MYVYICWISCFWFGYNGMVRVKKEEFMLRLILLSLLFSGCAEIERANRDAETRHCIDVCFNRHLNSYEKYGCGCR